MTGTDFSRSPDQGLHDFIEGLLPVLARTRETLSVSLRTYWPSNTWQVAEATLVTHLGAALLSHGWRVYTEVPDHPKSAEAPVRRRLDLLALHGQTKDPNATRLLVEAKQIQGENKASSAASDFKKMSEAILRPGSGASVFPDGPAFRLLVGLTTWPDPKTWWDGNTQTPFTEGAGWDALRDALTGTVRGSAPLYVDPMTPTPEAGWAANHLIWAVQHLKNAPAESSPAAPPEPHS